ncbi:MAG: hypothetical protein ABSA59_20705, partial [Terriglobia bacterium]
AQPDLECGSLLPIWLEPAWWLGFVLESKWPRTRSRGGKRQQAAALQSGLRPHKHWVRDTGLLQHISRDPAALAAELESRIIPQDKAGWQKGRIEDWVMEGHQVAQTVAYGNLSNANPAPITPAYERQADRVIELQLKRRLYAANWSVG